MFVFKSCLKEIRKKSAKIIKINFGMKKLKTGKDSAVTTKERPEAELLKDKKKEEKSRNLNLFGWISHQKDK